MPRAAIATPATTADGCVVNASEAAAADETVNALLVAVSRPLVAVSVLLPTRFTLSAANVATPVASIRSRAACSPVISAAATTATNAVLTSVQYHVVSSSLRVAPACPAWR